MIIKKPTLASILVSIILGLAMFSVGCLIVYDTVANFKKLAGLGVVWATERNEVYVSEEDTEWFVNPKTEFPTKKAREMIAIANSTLDNCVEIIDKTPPCHWTRVLHKVCLALREDLAKCGGAVDRYEAGQVKDWKGLHMMIANGFCQACFLEYLVCRFKEEEI